MKIGLLLPSVFMYQQYAGTKIFAPKQLFLDLADGLVARGHEVVVYSASDTQTKAALVGGNDDVALINRPIMRLRYMPEDAKRILAPAQARAEYEIELTARAYKDAKAGKVEIIHSYLESDAHYFADSMGIPTVYTLHDTVPVENSLDYWRLARFPVDHYVAISQRQADMYRSLISIFAVVHHGMHLDQYAVEMSPEDHVLFIGRYMPEKGVADAIQAAVVSGNSIKLASSPEYRSTEYYTSVLQPLINNKNVEEVGLLQGKEKSTLFGKAKAFLMPIQWEEPFGMVMIEAMACGTPVIAYNRGSVAEIVKDGVTGFIVDPDDTDRPGKGSWVIKKQGMEGLVEAINRIGEIDRVACRAHVEKRFTVEKMVAGYEQVYEKVLNKNHL